jgi:hypothetical protein
MKVRAPLPRWNNFTVPELKDILEHCVALEKLGIAQDEEMMASIERDVALREEEISGRHTRYELKPQKIRRQIVQNHDKRSQAQNYLLEQNV